MRQAEQQACNSLRRIGLREANRGSILQTLRRAQPLSRAEIARRSGISEGTVSRVVGELLDEKIVMEAGAESDTGGRPGTRLVLDSGHLRTIGVEILNWETRLALSTIDGKLLEQVTLRTPADPGETLDLVARECRLLARDIEPERLEGIGVSARGVVDNETGTVKIGNARAWNGMAIRDILQDSLKLPICVENNVRAAALAEYNSGNSDLQGSRCLLLVCVDEGIGVGTILDGSIYRGRHMAAGEFGMLRLAGCFGPGHSSPGACLEDLSDNAAICERYAALTESPRRARAAETRGRVRAICHAAMQGEEAARQTLAECMRPLGAGIVNLAWLLDPDMVVIEGAVTSAWPLVLDTILEQIPDRDLPNFRNLIIRPGVFGVDAELIGAALLPLETLFAAGARNPTLAAPSPRTTGTAPAAGTASDRSM